MMDRKQGYITDNLIWVEDVEYVATCNRCNKAIEGVERYFEYLDDDGDVTEEVCRECMMEAVKEERRVLDNIEFVAN